MPIEEESPAAIAGAPGVDPGALALWAAYAKDRFETASKRVDEFRNWARQLGAVVGVVIGLELTVLGKIIEMKAPWNLGLQRWCLVILLTSVFLHLRILLAAIKAGYIGHRVLGPEGAKKLVPHLPGKDEQEMNRVLGSYYAKAEERFGALSEEVGERVGQETSTFSRSLYLLFVGTCAWALLSWGAIANPSWGEHTFATASNLNAEEAFVTHSGTEKKVPRE